MALTVEQGTDRVVGMCAGVAPGERVAVLCDPAGDREAANALLEAAARAGADVLLIDVELEALGARVADADLRHDALEADVLIGVTSGASLYHSSLGRAAAARGARVLAMTGCTSQTLSIGAIEADFAAIEPRCLALADALTHAKQLTVTTSLGTELTAQLGSRDGYTCTGRATSAGDRTGFPDIEAFIAPLELTAVGQLVIDGSSTTYGLVDGPITIDISDGTARTFRGGSHAQRVEELLKSHGSNAMTLAEFGFGLNPCARVIGSIIEDEATYGTGHVAFGSNEGFGGVNAASLHLDLVYWHPTLLLDDQTVIRGGELLLSAT